jgi:NAD(P)-dependent dehydrogenase (short-subunit alcohol dehydrogenase family)
MNDDKQPLKGRVALITGGSRGIGAGITRKLASWGCTVCINYVDRARPARALADEVIAQGGQATIHQADLSQPEDIEALLADVGRAHGRLNILVANAAATTYSTLEDASLADWEFVQDTNSRATWLLAKHAIDLLRDQVGARFITITNSSTIRVTPRAGLFAAAKAAVETLTEYLSYELAPYDIVANCVRPGLVMTDVTKVRPDYLARARQELSISPWGIERMSTVEDTANAVAMLCQDEAAWIAGQIITVDGGYRLWGGSGLRRSGAGDAASAVPGVGASSEARSPS